MSRNQHVGSHPNIAKHFLIKTSTEKQNKKLTKICLESPVQWRCPIIDMGHLERLWNLLWRSSKAIWTQPWATFSGWPYLTQEVGPDDLKMSLLDSITLWQPLSLFSKPQFSMRVLRKNKILAILRTLHEILKQDWSLYSLGILFLQTEIMNVRTESLLDARFRNCLSSEALQVYPYSLPEFFVTNIPNLSTPSTQIIRCM